MELQEIQRKEKTEIKTIVVSIKTTPTVSEWMTKHNIAPSKLFHKAVEELMKKNK